MEPKLLGTVDEGMRWGCAGTLPLVSKLPQSFKDPRELAPPGFPLLGPSTTWIRDALSFDLILSRDSCHLFCGSHLRP